MFCFFKAAFVELDKCCRAIFYDKGIYVFYTDIDINLGPRPMHTKHSTTCCVLSWLNGPHGPFNRTGPFGMHWTKTHGKKSKFLSRPKRWDRNLRKRHKCPPCLYNQKEPYRAVWSRLVKRSTVCYVMSYVC